MTITAEKKVSVAPKEAEPPSSAAVLTPEHVFTEYAPRIYQLVKRLLGNAADADDVTQQVFMQVVRKLKTFRGESAFSTWLYRVAINTALSYRRERSVQREHEVLNPFEDFAEDGSHFAPVRHWTSPATAAVDRETHEVIEQAINDLPEPYRDVFVLADVEEMSNPEIADLLGLSLPAVKSRLHRARLLVRKTLAPYFEEQTG